MIKQKMVLLIIIIGMFCQLMRGQEEKLTAKDSVVVSSWIVGVGVNIVDDSGDTYRQLFAVDDEWNMVPFPSRLSIGRYFKNGLGIEAIGTYNKYKKGKIIDDVVNDHDKEYYAIDGRITYDLNKIVGETGFFDPYIGIGAGYTDANEQPRGTYNAILGFRLWFSEHWAADISSTGKWSMGKEASNHIQHAVGVAYQFGIEKELSKKGMEKLALLQELEKEKQRVQDSIAAAEKAERDAKELAERLQREKDAKLAEEQRLERERKQQEIADAIKDLGNVYFSFNSSYLTSTDKQLLDKLGVILENNPTLILEITSHTDSRGTDKYNQWLSDRRAQRTLEYLLSKGLADDRVKAKGYGESQLINECTDGTWCPESKHKVNRRSEFIILNF